jgi:hypothetical protein
LADSQPKLVSPAFLLADPFCSSLSHVWLTDRAPTRRSIALRIKRNQNPLQQRLKRFVVAEK